MTWTMTVLSLGLTLRKTWDQHISLMACLRKTVSAALVISHALPSAMWNLGVPAILFTKLVES